MIRLSIIGSSKKTRHKGDALKNGTTVSTRRGLGTGQERRVNRDFGVP